MSRNSYLVDENDAIVLDEADGLAVHVNPCHQLGHLLRFHHSERFLNGQSLALHRLAAAALGFQNCSHDALGHFASLRARVVNRHFELNLTNQAKQT